MDHTMGLALHLASAASDGEIPCLAYREMGQATADRTAAAGRAMADAERALKDAQRQYADAERVYNLAYALIEAEAAESDPGLIYGWLKANGVDEPVPDHPSISTDLDAGTFTYVGYRWAEQRGWTAAWKPSVEGLEARTLPMLRPPGPLVLAAIERIG